MFGMKLDAMRIRWVFMASGLVALGLYLMAGGKLVPGSQGTIQIEYGMYPREFEGLEVEIDGEVAGKLTGYGSATRSGFAVKEGDHRVRVLHPRYGSRAMNVEVKAGLPALLILDFQESASRDGGSQPVLAFQ